MTIMIVALANAPTTTAAASPRPNSAFQLSPGPKPIVPMASAAITASTSAKRRKSQRPVGMLSGELRMQETRERDGALAEAHRRPQRDAGIDDEDASATNGGERAPLRAPTNDGRALWPHEHDVRIPPHDVLERDGGRRRRNRGVDVVSP